MSSRPIALGDVEVLLSEAVPDWEKLVEVSEEGGVVVLQRRRYLQHEEFDLVHQAVKRMGGRYRSEERDFIIPLAQQKASEKPSEGSEVDIGVLFSKVPVKALVSMPFKSRLEPGRDIEELAESIRQHGILEPVLVRPKPDDLFEMVAGERRVRAAQRAGLFEVPVIIRPMSDQEAMEVQMVENLHRKDLSDYEKARWLNEMIRRFGYTQEDLAEKIGKTQGWVAQHLRILELEPIITRVIIEGLTERQARALLSAPEEIRPQVAKWVESQHPNLPSSMAIKAYAQTISPTVRGVEETSEVTVEAEQKEASEVDVLRDIEKFSLEVRADEEAHAIEKAITGLMGSELSEIKADLVEKQGLSEQEAEEALSRYRDTYPDMWSLCYDEKGEPKRGFTSLPSSTESAEARKTVIQPAQAGKGEEREIDQAVFTCKYCGESFLIVHLEPSGRHKLRPVRVEDEP